MNDSSANLTMLMNKEYKQYINQSQLAINHHDPSQLSNLSVHKKEDANSSDSANLLKDLEGINQQSAIYDQNNAYQNSNQGSIENQQTNDSYDQMSLNRNVLRAEIFSNDILEELEEYESDEEEGLTHYQRHRMKRQHSENKKRKQEMNQIAQFIQHNQVGEEERKIMRTYLDEDIVDEEYRKAISAIGKKEKDSDVNGDLSPSKQNRKHKSSSSSLNSNSATNLQNVTDFRPHVEMPQESQYYQYQFYVNHLKRTYKHLLHEPYQTSIKRKNCHEFELFLVQELRAHSDSIWAAKFSPCGQYLATGGKDAVLKIWQINQLSHHDESKMFTLADCWKIFQSVPYREYREHEYDILDIAWCKERPNLLLTCSFDQRVILWDLNQERPVQIYEHPDVPVKVQFNPELDNLFVSGCLDKGIRLWSIDEKTQPIDIMQTQDYITALQFSENGKRLVVGLATGYCVVYSCDSLGRLNYITRVDCKNRRGKFSSGRKITGIAFLNKSEVIISTNDSRLRHINLEDCIQKYKYKGHLNENLQIEGTLSYDQNYLISGSEDGQVYIWNRIHDIPLVGSKYQHGSIYKNKVKAYESFQPYTNEKILSPVSIFAPKETLSLMLEKYQRLQNQSFQTTLKSVIVTCSTDGRIRIFLDEKFDNKINEEEEELEDYEGVEEVSVKSSDEEDNISEEEINTHRIVDEGGEIDEDEREYQNKIRELQKYIVE